MYFPNIIAHRGVPHLAPENTMASFKAAIAMGVDGIETDIQLTKDGVMVICHDEMLDRTTDGKGLLKDYTLRELKSISAGSWFSDEFAAERIPTLEEFLDLVKDTDIMLDIEIKSGVVLYPGIEKKLIAMLREFGLGERTIISSFNHYSLVECKGIDSAIKTGALYMCGLVSPWEYAKRIGADALHPYFYNVRPEIMKGIRENNVVVNPFTVNGEAQMKYMIRMGVDGIITDYPDRLHKLKKEMSNAYEA